MKFSPCAFSDLAALVLVFIVASAAHAQGSVHPINPNNQIARPSSCTGLTPIHNVVTDQCEPARTAGNPAGTTGQIQANCSGAFCGLEGVMNDSAGGLGLGGVTRPASAPAGTISAAAVYVPGGAVDITLFGAKCDWNGTTGTDDTAAWNAAWAYLHTLPFGGTITMPACLSYVPNGLNWSTSTVNYAASWKIKGQGKTSSVIVTKNANVGMDLGGVNNVYLEDFELTDVGTTAKVGIARYRVLMAGGNYGGVHHIYRNIEVFGAYSLAALYSVGSEVNDSYSSDYMQLGAGSGVTVSSQNCLGLTGQGQPIPTSSSDTVNNFYGGEIGTSGPSTGGAVLFCNGNTDNLNFRDTYMENYSSGYIVQFGATAGDGIQGSKGFHNIRIEGDVDAFRSIVSGTVDAITIDDGTAFEENSPGIDFNWTATPRAGSYGLLNSTIRGNTHLGHGLVIPLITRSKIEVGTVFNASTSFPATNIDIQQGASQSEIEADGFTWGSSAYVNGTQWTVNTDNINYGYRYTMYGPLSPTAPYGAAANFFAMQPFGAPPGGSGTGTSVPPNGTSIMADCNHWHPWPCTTPTAAWWNANTSAWQSPVNSVPADFGVGGNLPVGGSLTVGGNAAVGGNLPVNGLISNNAGGLGTVQNQLLCSTFASGCLSTNWSPYVASAKLTPAAGNDIYGNNTVLKAVSTATYSGIVASPPPTLRVGSTYTFSVYAYDPAGTGTFLLALGNGAGSCETNGSGTRATTVNTRYYVTCTIPSGLGNAATIRSMSGTVYFSLPLLEVVNTPGPPGAFLYTTAAAIPPMLGLAVAGKLANTSGGGGAAVGARTVTASTDTITRSDAGYIITYNSASLVATAVNAVSSLGAGFSADIYIQGTGTVTFTPASGTINGQTTFSMYPGQKGFLYSPDGTNLRFLSDTDMQPSLFAQLPACGALVEGTKAPVTDSTTSTWGATVTGSGTPGTHVLAYCDGTNWTVEAK